MNVLVTGGFGFLGQHLVRALHQREDVKRIMVVDKDPFPGGWDDLPKTVYQRFVLCADQLPDLDGIDMVFHFAAEPSVEACERRPELAWGDARLTQELYEYCCRWNVKKFVFASSCAVYGDKHSTHEDGLLKPITTYGVGKAAAELAVLRRTGHSGKLVTNFSHDNRPIPRAGQPPTEVLVLRFFNVYGPGQGQHECEINRLPVVPAYIRSALAGLPIVIQGSPEKCRDLIYVHDAIACVEYLTFEGCTGIFNVGNGEDHSLYEIAKHCNFIADCDETITCAPHLGSGPQTIRANTQKLRMNGWNRTPTKLLNGLTETTLWHQERRLHRPYRR